MSSVPNSVWIVIVVSPLKVEDVELVESCRVIWIWRCSGSVHMYFSFGFWTQKKSLLALGASAAGLSFEICYWIMLLDFWGGYVTWDLILAVQLSIDEFHQPPSTSPTDNSYR